MKILGTIICIGGSILAILFPPLTFMGINAGFGFLFGHAGFGIKNYQLLNTSTFFLELILINGIGMTLYVVGKKQESAVATSKSISAKDEGAVTPNQPPKSIDEIVSNLDKMWKK